MIMMASGRDQRDVVRWGLCFLEDGSPQPFLGEWASNVHVDKELDQDLLIENEGSTATVAVATRTWWKK